MNVLCVVAARPNYIKVAPVHQALCEGGHRSVLIHTGQHYDKNMSDVFFSDLKMPVPEENLRVGAGSHAVQTAQVMERFEPVLQRYAPDVVLVAGDVNSTLACALVAAKCHVPVAHLEAGLRSFDRTMPEEINRVLTDHLSEVLLTPSADANANLEAEGLAQSRIYLVGNAMIDSLRKHLPYALEICDGVLARLQVTAKNFALVTLHRAATVDDAAKLAQMMTTLATIAQDIPVVFPIHPRTHANLRAALGDVPAGLKLLEPLGYLEFLALQATARMVLTDSGGIQEESTALGVPCLTLRANTERPITILEGTNTLVGLQPASVVAAVTHIIRDGGKVGRIPHLWDGHAAQRIVQALLVHMSRPSHNETA